MTIKTNPTAPDGAVTDDSAPGAGSDGAGGEGSAGAPPPAPAAKAVVRSASGDGPDVAPTVTVSLSDEQLRAMKEQEAKAAQAKLLKELGFTKPDDLKSFMKVAKEALDAQLTEQQRVQKQLDELRPAAERATMLEAQLTALVEEQFGALPETQRAAIDTVANGDATKRLELMRVLKMAGIGGAMVPESSAASASAAPVAPPVAAPDPAPAPAKVAPKTAPKASGGPQTAWDKFSSLKQSGRHTQATLFYQLNASEIERNRPQP